MIPVRPLAWIAAVAIPALVVPVAGRACSGGVHIELREAGAYMLDHAAIVAAQPRLADCRSEELVLTQRGQEVPLRIVGDRDGAFGPGARIEWIGEALHGPQSWFDAYALDNVYILSAAAGRHRRMRDEEERSGAPARLVRRVHFEQQNEFIRLNSSTMKQGEEPDIWQWARLTHVDPKPFTFEFALPDLAAGEAAGATVEVLLDFRGISWVTRFKPNEKPVDHVVEVQVNGRQTATVKWDGRGETEQKLLLPRAAFKADGNVLALRVPERYRPGDKENAIIDQIMFNWVEFAYPVAGNLAVSAAPLQAAAGAGAASIELSAPSGAAVVVYDRAGVRHEGVAGGDGRLRFGNLVRGADVYPVIGSDLRKPAFVRAVADADLRNPGAGYDYLIVSHHSLLDAVAPLAEYHRRNGLKVALLDVDDVYDQFNGGITHPSAIRDLIAWGREHWSVKPRYVLLVGTASFDIRESGKAVSMQPESFDPRTGVPFAKRTDSGADTKPASRNLIPTWQYPSDEGQSASDNPFVALDAKDSHPALAIGRFPVVTAAEAEAVVRKTIDYAASPSLGAWRHRVMMIANEDQAFQSASDQIAASLGNEGFTAQKVYGKVTEADNLAHQAEIFDGLNAGDLLVHFLGHGGRFIWRTGPPDLNKNHDLFTLDDVSNLENEGRLPMVLSMTCFSAPFDNPSEDSIGERFLREPGRGAVAVFAASWSNSPSTEFSKKLVAELVKPGQRIGDAIVAAKRAISNPTLIEMYNLLGDPALVLAQPRGRLQLVRSGDRWRDTVSVRVPESDFGGTVNVDWIDAGGEALQSQAYEVRDRQFQLAVPAGAEAVRVYAANLRTGRDAMGTLQLRAAPTPADARSAGAPRDKTAAPAPKAAAVPAVPAPAANDPIHHRGFDAPAAAAPTKTPSRDQARQ